MPFRVACHLRSRLGVRLDSARRKCRSSQTGIAGCSNRCSISPSPIVLAAGFTVIYTVGFLAFLLLHPVPQPILVEVDNIATILGPIVLLPFALGWLAHRWRRRPRSHEGRTAPSYRSWAATFLALGVLTDTLGQTIWTFYAQVLHQPTPFPSWADASYLCTYPLLLIGILLLPKGAMSAAAKTRLSIDGLVIMTGAFTFSWFFVLGPTMMQGGESLLAKAVGTAYPFEDLLLIGALVILLGHLNDRRGRSIGLVLVMGLTCMVVADSVFDFQTLHNTYRTGELLDVLWPLSDLLIAVAAITVIALPERRVEVSADLGQDIRPHGYLGTWIMYVLVPAVGILDGYLLIAHGDTRLVTGVVFGSVVLVGLILLRQFLALLENAELSRKLRLNNDELIHANLRLEALATTDPLTDVLNHRGVVTALENELERARRYNHPFAILFMDIDHFKQVNDVMGHNIGDHALYEFASSARALLRGVDVLGRWGGEEFVAVLPETETGKAVAVAERIRSGVAEQSSATQPELRLTCSVGVASYPQDGSAIDELISIADDAMYAAKRLGRNQVRVAADRMLTAPSMDRDGAHISMVLTVSALASLVDARDHYTGDHTVEVVELSRRIAVALGLQSDEVRIVELAARLHDIGKVAVPDAILLKPSRLTPEEWALIRRHPGVGADVLLQMPSLEALAPIVRGHHERFAGAGYPDGLIGEAIPFGARIVAVADAFAAMTSDRPYQNRVSESEALRELDRCAGDQFDPAVVAALHGLVVSGEQQTNVA